MLTYIPTYLPTYLHLLPYAYLPNRHNLPACVERIFFQLADLLKRKSVQDGEADLDDEDTHGCVFLPCISMHDRYSE